jgi:hypothetical protein
VHTSYLEKLKEFESNVSIARQENESLLQEVSSLKEKDKLNSSNTSNFDPETMNKLKTFDELQKQNLKLKAKLKLMLAKEKEKQQLHQTDSASRFEHQLLITNTNQSLLIEDDHLQRSSNF